MDPPVPGRCWRVRLLRLDAASRMPSQRLLIVEHGLQGSSQALAQSQEGLGRFQSRLVGPAGRDQGALPTTDCAPAGGERSQARQRGLNRSGARMVREVGTALESEPTLAGPTPQLDRGRLQQALGLEAERALELVRILASEEGLDGLREVLAQPVHPPWIGRRPRRA